MLKTRVVTALILLAILLPIVFWLPAIYLSIFFLLIVVIAAWEWVRLIFSGSRRAEWIYVTLCLFVILGLLWINKPILEFALLFLAAAFWIFTAPFLLAQGMGLTLQKWSIYYCGFGLILLPATWFALIYLRHIGLIFLLSTVALVWVADIGAYFIGKAFGKHRLAPQISPGKSIEGALGGLLLCYVYAVLCTIYLPLDATLFGSWVLNWGWLSMLLMTSALTAFSIFGDLFESQLKRLAGVKDSGRLLPGHGGVLDRVDALLPVMPLAALLAGML